MVPIPTGSGGGDRNGLITTGSISTTQSITGSLIISGSGIELDIKGDQNITGSLNEVGDLYVISPNQTTDFSNISSSNKGNIIFGL